MLSNERTQITECCCELISEASSVKDYYVLIIQNCQEQTRTYCTGISLESFEADIKTQQNSARGAALKHDDRREKENTDKVNVLVENTALSTISCNILIRFSCCDTEQRG